MALWVGVEIVDGGRGRETMFHDAVRWVGSRRRRMLSHPVRDWLMSRSIAGRALVVAVVLVVEASIGD